MNIFCNSSGEIFHVIPERIFQGSAGVNRIYFIGQFPSSAQVLMSYTLPNGLQTSPKMLALNSKLEEVQAPNGGKFAVWEGRIGASPKVENGQVVTDENGNIVYDLDYTITENYGTATIQFFVYGASNGGTDSVGVLATASTNFIIEKGVPVLLPMSFDEEGDVQQILAQILNILANTQTLYDNVDEALYGEEGTAESPTQNSIAGRLETAEEDITNLDNLVAANTLSINTQLGAGISVLYNPTNGILTFVLLNKEGTILSNQTVDLPLELLIISGEYDAESKDIILRLQSGDTISVPVDDLVDGLISTSEKGQPNGVAELNADGVVPESQLPPLDYVKRTGDTMSGPLNISAGGPDLKMQYGYEVTFGGNGFGYWYDGIRRIGENAAHFAFPSDVLFGVIAVRSDLAPLQRQLELHSQVIMQSGLVYTADDVNTWNERVTADGANVLDGSKAVLKKVVGSTVACKNLIPYPYLETTKTENGVTFTDNGNGTITLNGTATASTTFVLQRNNTDIILRQGETVTISAEGSTEGAYIYLDVYVNGTLTSIGGTIGGRIQTKTIQSNAVGMNLLLTAESGNTFNNLTIKPMIEYGTTATEYQPYFTGLKSASFGGIESKNADGTETATLAFPKTEMPLGKTIDFEKKKITDYGVEISADYPSIFYTEATNLFTFSSINANASFNLKAVSSYYPYDNFGSSGGTGFWITSDGEDLRIRDSRFTSVDELKAWMAENNVTIRYVSETLQSETDFTADNEYTAYKGGTETVLDNDGNEYGADNTMTMNYVFVSEVQQ